MVFHFVRPQWELSVLQLYISFNTYFDALCLGGESDDVVPVTLSS